MKEDPEPSGAQDLSFVVSCSLSQYRVPIQRTLDIDSMDAAKRAVIDYLVYLVVRIFICCLQILSLEKCRQLSYVIGVLATDILKIRRSLLEENLSHALPELNAAERRDLAIRCWAHLFLMVCEIAHLPRKLHDTNWRQYVTFCNKRETLRYLLDERATVFVTGHFGNFEAAGYVIGLFGFPSFTIARPLDNKFLHQFVNDFRSMTGQFILPKQGSAKHVDAVLQAGGTLSLLGDQYAGPKGCWVEFLNRPASCHKAIAVFTLLSGAPQLVSVNRRVGGPLEFELGTTAVADPQKPMPALDGVRQLTEWSTRHLETLIRENPEQYWWIHRRWKGTPPKRFFRQQKAA